LSEVHINKRILDKISKIDESEKFKELLVESLIFEKDQMNLGESEYTKKYDGLTTRFKDDVK
jgi:hypothetical protein